ncbi:hypothetical protein CRG98_032287 [Punica granatum]|uniref:Uncharacterized protein n=1 Tax=Punica granatum TaxID=22663 RepID=A0A2I0ITI2_PUNGR|nr:hypothetical protein CRG98_032287 [Punica granatum]
MEVGTGPQIGGAAPESIGISNSRSQSIREIGPPIGDFDPTLEVSDILCGCRQLWWWGRGRRLAAQREKEAAHWKMCLLSVGRVKEWLRRGRGRHPHAFVLYRPNHIEYRSNSDSYADVATWLCISPLGGFSRWVLLGYADPAGKSVLPPYPTD